MPIDRTRRPAVPRFPAPIRSETGTVPTDDGTRLHNRQRLDGIWHQMIQPNKDQAIQLPRGFVPSYFRTIGRRPSPRSIKALLFKLQLARLLLQLRYPGLRDEKNE